MNGPTSREKHALLVGIDVYPFFPPENQLKGCVHDAELMAEVLEKRFEFSVRQIQVLRDSEATRGGILAAMSDLQSRVGEGDIVVFFYSGHGSQMLSDDPRESDGLDETLVPHDSGRRGHPNRDVRDKEIHDWILRLSQRTEWITVIFDSCHSGGTVRNSNERRVEPDLRAPGRGLEQPQRTRSATPVAQVVRKEDRGTSGWLPRAQRYVLLAASRDRETACELPADEAGGIAHGAFTYHLCRELLAALPEATYRDVVELAAPRVTRRFPHQHPQVEGARDRRLFGSRVAVPDSYVVVRERRDDVAVLAGGAAHGLAVGSRWDAYPPGTKYSADAVCLGRLEVLETSAVEASALILEESVPGAVTGGCRAIERELPVDAMQLSVAIEPPVGEIVRLLEERFGLSIALSAPPSADQLLAGLDRSTLLKPCLEVGDDPSFRCFEVRLEDWMTGAAGSHWLAIDRIGEPVAPLRSLEQQGSIESLIADLEARARYLRVLTLENPDIWNPLRGQVELEIRRRASGREAWQEPETLPSGELCLDDGDRLALRIRHHFSEPLYVCVLNLGVTGSIEGLYPPPGACDTLDSERLLEFGTARGDEIEVRIPPEYPFVGDRNTVAGTAYVKLLATTQATDFGRLTQLGPTPVSSSAPADAAGKVTRGIQRRGSGQWLALTKNLYLRRRLHT